MFYKSYDDLISRLNSGFIKKKTIQELAVKFAELGKQQDVDNPFEQGMIALATFGEMLCYEKLGDKLNLIRTAIAAARLFVKSAKFNFEVSRTIRDLWSDPLADGIQCYKTAYKALKSDGKPNLAVSVLNELAQVETQFEFHHYAGNTYEEAIMFCIQKNLRPRVMIEATLECVRCYFRCDRYDLALAVLDRVIQKLEQSFMPIVSTSPLMRQEFEDLRVLKAQMLFCTRRFQECIEYATPALDPRVVDILAKFCSMDQAGTISQAGAFLDEAKKIKGITELNIQIFEKRCNMVGK